MQSMTDDWDLGQVACGEYLEEFTCSLFSSRCKFDVYSSKCVALGIDVFG
jgi:hypothetical protein